MVRVESKGTLHLLTKRFMRMNKGRNRIAVLAVMLTSLLFTSLFAGTVSLILSKRAADIRSFMDSSHAIAQNLPDKAGEGVLRAIKADDKVDRFGQGIFLGALCDDRVQFSGEVRYADKYLAESFNCTPEKGRLPRKADEAAISTLVLDAMGIPHKLGEKVEITWEQNPVTGEKRTDTFRLCGFWKGDKAVLGQMVWLSEEYALKNRYPVTGEELKNGVYNGGRDFCVWFKNEWNLQKKTAQLSENAGFIGKGNGFEVNPAYDLMEEDAFSFGSVIVMVCFVILAGYLIIYNIFNISIKTDIRTYGLLKNVGTTGKQLKKIVRMQAWYLSAVGIPAGLLLGYGAAVLMAPSLSASAQIDSSASDESLAVVSAHPLIFLAAGAFTLLTVYLSSIQACRMVEHVSPVEALRLADGEQTKRKVKRNTSVSWWGMAAGNMLKNWKKGLIVMLSVALSMVVVDGIVMMVGGYDFDAYKQTFLAADFQVDQLGSSADMANFYAITPKIRELLDKSPGKISAGYVYYLPESHEMEESLLEVWEENAKNHGQDWSEYEKELWKEAKAKNQIRVHLMGVNEPAFDKLEWKEKPCSWEEFQSGNYVITDFNDRYTVNWENPESYYREGDVFSLEVKEKGRKEYQVLGEAKMPFALDYPYADCIYLTVILPEEEFIRFTGEDRAMYGAVDVEKGREKEMRQYIKDTVLRENDMMNLFSVLDMRESFQRYLRKYYVVGAFLVAVLTFIGIMNFFNTMAASVLSRKKELALLEAVGMTKRQILKMLIAEGGIYIGGAFVLAILIICTCAKQILTNTIGKAFFFSVHLTVLPCILLLPVLAVIAYAIPKHEFKKMNRESVVERIRNE